MSTYCISDLHGLPIEKLKDLLSRAGFGEGDFLFVLGDVVDRNGDGGLSLLRGLMATPDAEFILGNHEAMLLSCEFVFGEITEENIDALEEMQMRLLKRYLRNGGQVTLNALRSISEEERNDILDFLREAPLWEAVTAGERDYILVHAGLGNFSPDKKLSEYAPDELVWTRPALDERYFEDIMTVAGHTPTFIHGEQYDGLPVFTDTWIDIDSGAAYGREPVLLRLDDLRWFR